MWSLGILAILGYLVFIVVWIPVAFASAVATGGCACGHFLQREREETDRWAPGRIIVRILGLVMLPFTLCCLDVGDEYPRVEAMYVWLEFEVKEAWRKLNARDVIPVMPVVERKEPK